MIATNDDCQLLQVRNHCHHFNLYCCLAPSLLKDRKECMNLVDSPLKKLCRIKNKEMPRAAS